MAARNAKNGRPKATMPTITLDSLLSDEQFEAQGDRLVANMLAGIASENARLRKLMQVNEHTEDDIVPNEPMTYAQALERLTDNLSKIKATCGEEQVERAVKLLQGS